MKPTREEIIAAEKAAGWSGIYSQWESPTERTHTTVPVTQEQIDRFFLAAYKAGMLRAAEIAEKPPEDAYDEGTLYPLYAAPVVQPDMVMVPREATEAMLDAAMNRYKHVSPEARLHFFQMHRENFRCDYKAMIAAAEGKG